MSSEKDQQYCAAQVRDYDYQRYFAAAFAPLDARRALYALYAFNLEIASTRERVSETLIGEMRLQWWRDTLDGIYAGAVRRHAIAEELARAIGRYGLDRPLFDTMIDARSFDLDDAPPEDMPALERYADATAGGLAALAGAVCGSDDARLRQAGLAWGLAGILRAAAFHASIGKVFVPRDALRRAGVTPDGFRRGAGAGIAAAAVAPVAARAAALLEKFAADFRDLPRPARPATAYVAVAQRYLQRLERAGNDVFAGGLEPGRLGAQWPILRAAVAGRI